MTQLASAGVDSPPQLPARVAAAVSPDICHGYVVTLAEFGTRHTLSTTDHPTRGIGAARNWIKATLDGFATAENGLQVSFEAFMQPPTANRRIREETEIINVVAVLPGSMPEAAGRRYYIVGHYDSRNAGEMDAEGDAPGANDDASGTAVVMEIARVLAGMGPLESTVVFLATAGEEQGLLGARYHADQAAGRGENIVAVLSNDIVGDPSTPEGFAPTPGAHHIVRVFSEGIPRNPSAQDLAQIRALSAESDSPSRQLARFIAEVARAYDLPVKPRLIFRPDRFLRGGDHSAFNEAGFAAVRFSELDEDYSRQHADVTERDGLPYGDVPEFVDKDYLAGVTMLNAAAVAALANAPSAPADARILTAELSNGTSLKWSPSPEPDVAGYEIVWRATTEATWTNTKDVGNVTEATLELSKDDWFFGVRAYDRDGYRSLVAFPAAARR